MPDINTSDLRIDSNQLYLEEVFTDRRIGTIRRLTPVKSDGSTDPAREVLYVGQGQIMTPLGTIPLSFEIDADTLEAATEKFPEGMKKAVDETMEEMKELRRQAASSIVVPEVGGGVGGAGSPPGVMPGGGKIKMP